MRYAVIVLALAVTGCSTTWDKPGATQAEFNRDTYACQRDAYGTGGGAIGYASGSYVTVQGTPNMPLYRSCMAAKGYTAR